MNLCPSDRPQQPPYRLLAIVAYVLFLLSSLAAPQAAAQQVDAIPVDWSKIGDRGHQVRVNARSDSSTGVTTIETLGTDPYFFFTIPPLPASDRTWVLEFEYFCADGIEDMQWRNQPDLDNAFGTPIAALAKSEGWTTYAVDLEEFATRTDWKMPTTARIDLGRRGGLSLQVRNVRVRPVSDRELKLRKTAEVRRIVKNLRAEQIRRYRERAWPATIESASRSSDEIRVRGRIEHPDQPAKYWVLARDGTSIAAAPPTDREQSHRWELNATGGTFAVSIPLRHSASWFAAGTRLQIFAEADGILQPLSPASYVDVPSDSDVPPTKRLAAAKGLTCITPRLSVEQLSALGIEHGTVNLVLSGLVSKIERPGWTATDIGGRRWWVNEGRLRSHDGNVRRACDAGLVVAGIMLIPTSNGHPSAIAHPESTAAGTYAMPNLNDPEAQELYRTTIELITERYSGKHPELGRIDHWIAHNEVDYAWQWTNMGPQPFELLMDHYVRSMRLIDQSARKHNPHAHVFISLTHRWNTDDNQPWKTYSPRAMVRWLIDDCQLEGDFAWGVAYHPYPQSLWHAAFWKDTQTTDDFDSPLITIKNLQVLDRFMHQPASRNRRGEVRPVICSEQGFHADANNPEDLNIQSAALLKTWQVLRDCPSILAFDYHRPSDHPNEGGLRLGLRGLPSADDPLGAPKPAWETFSAIGTDREPALVERYRRFWIPSR